MPRTIRSRNLNLVRWLNFGHEHICKILAPIANKNYVSKMATGDREITDHMARRIEELTNMPEKWIDRDNDALLQMSSLDHALHTNISSLPETTKITLLAFVETLKLTEPIK